MPSLRCMVKVRLYHSRGFIGSYYKSTCLVLFFNLVLFYIWWLPFQGISIQDVDIYSQDSRETNGFLARSYFYKGKDLEEGLAGDPRLMPALWLHYIRQVLQNDVNDVDIPFSWSSWLDLDGPIDRINPLNCTSLHSSTIKVLCAIDLPMSEKERQTVGKNYLLYSAPVPQRLIFLGVPKPHHGLIIPVLQSRIMDYRDKRYLLNIYQDQDDDYIELGDEVEALNHVISKRALFSFIDDHLLTHDILRVTGHVQSTSITKQDFDFTFQPYSSSLKERVNKSYKLLRINDLDSRLLSNIRHSIDGDYQFPKYFHEALIHNDLRGTHYDWRFFKTLHHSEYEKKAILHRLTRTWLRFSSTIGIHSWLAHGSLLGWYWNGMTMPWDLDLDVQVTMKSLIHLARNYNQTLIVDMSLDLGINMGIGSYLLDIGPSFFSRDLGNGLNTIDARLIDTVSGFYVDITALASTPWVEQFAVGSKQANELNQVLDPEYVTKERSHTIRKEDIQRELETTKTNLISSQSLFKCKNNHYFTWKDIYPLKKTMFEGISAWVPNQFMNILKREYSHGLYSRQHEGHTYRPVLDLWVPNHICRQDPIGNNCFDKETLLEAKYTKPITSKHRSEIAKKVWDYGADLPPIRTDPWIIETSKKRRKEIH